MNKDKITVIEEMVQTPTTSSEPGLYPIFIGPMYDVRNETFAPTVTSWVLYKSHYDSAEGTVKQSTETVLSEDDLSTAISTFLSAHSAQDPIVSITVNCKYTPTPGFSSNAVVYADNLRDKIYERQERVNRYTIAGTHLHDDSTDFYATQIKKDDVVVLPNGLKFKIKLIARNDLYFYDDTVFDTNIDLPLNSYTVYRYRSNVELAFSITDGTIHFSADIPWESLDETTFRFFDKSLLSLPMAIKEYVSGEYDETIDNPLGFACALANAKHCYYIPASTYADFYAASELIHDSWLPYTVVPLTQDSSIISLFIPQPDFYSGEEIKIVLATTGLNATKRISTGTGSIYHDDLPVYTEE